MKGGASLRGFNTILVVTVGAGGRGQGVEKKGEEKKVERLRTKLNDQS